VAPATKVCTTAELSPSAALRVVLEGKPIAVVMDSAGAVHALGDTCTHGDISLSEGFVEDDTLECWAHGSKFELASGKPLTLPAYEPVPVYTVSIVDGDVFIDPTPIDHSDSVAV
jgi:3-phenylpropionate/trans-cinnamate dioxygenase ferredoxin subunit